MASVKNLKKDINYTLGDIIGECNVWELENPTADTTKSQAIVEEAIHTFDELIAKVHAKDIANRKAHFKSINEELETRANALVDKFNAL